MSKKLDEQLKASMQRRRDPMKLAEDHAATPFAQLAAQVKEQTMIPIAAIFTSPFQSRVDAQPESTEEDEDYLANLAATIERDGLLNPVLVRVSDSDTLIPDGPKYELIAGENRVRAHLLLGREVIPAKVLRLSDVEAARALTVDNLVRRPMTDWELYLHVVMLKEVGAATTQKELAGLLGCARSKVGMLECFGRLPNRVREILAEKPGLLGATQVQALAAKGFLEAHPDAVADAVEKVAEGKIGQTGMVGFIERRVRAESPSDRREYQLSIGKAKVRVVSKDSETRITGDVDSDALREILQSHLERLVKRKD